MYCNRKLLVNVIQGKDMKKNTYFQILVEFIAVPRLMLQWQVNLRVCLSLTTNYCSPKLLELGSRMLSYNLIHQYGHSLDQHIKSELNIYADCKLAVWFYNVKKNCHEYKEEGLNMLPHE